MYEYTAFSCGVLGGSRTHECKLTCPFVSILVRDVNKLSSRLCLWPSWLRGRKEPLCLASYTNPPKKVILRAHATQHNAMAPTNSRTSHLRSSTGGLLDERATRILWTSPRILIVCPFGLHFLLRCSHPQGEKSLTNATPRRLVRGGRSSYSFLFVESQCEIGSGRLFHWNNIPTRKTLAVILTVFENGLRVCP